MHVLAYLPMAAVEVLRCALGQHDRLQAVGSWQELMDWLRRQWPEPVNVLVCDPLIDPDGESDERPAASWEVALATAVRRRPALPVVLYAQLDGRLPKVLLASGRYGVDEIVIRYHNDAPAQLRRVLEQVTASMVGARLWGGMSHRLLGGRAPRVGTIRRVLLRPYEFPTLGVLVRAAAALAEHDTISVYRARHALDRWLERHGIASARTVLICARVGWAYAALRRPGTNVKQVAARLGYAKVRTLTRHIGQVAGCRPSELAKTVLEEALVAHLGCLVMPGRDGRGVADRAR